MKAHMRCSHTSVREKLRWVHISLACLATYTVGGRRLVSWDQKQTLLIYLNRHRQTHSWDQKRAFGWSHIGTSWCPIECTVRHHPFHKSLNRMRVLQSEVSQRQHTKAREEVSDQGSKKQRRKTGQILQNLWLCRVRDTPPSPRNAWRNVSSQNGLPGLGIWQAYSVVSGAVYACTRQTQWQRPAWYHMTRGWNGDVYLRCRRKSLFMGKQLFILRVQ